MRESKTFLAKLWSLYFFILPFLSNLFNAILQNAHKYTLMETRQPLHVGATHLNHSLLEDQMALFAFIRGILAIGSE